MVEKQDDELNPIEHNPPCSVFTEDEIRALRGSYHDLFLLDIKSYETVETFLAALSGFAHGRKGITMRCCGNELIGFTCVGGARVKMEAKEDIREIRAAWIAMLDKLKPKKAGIHPENTHDMLRMVQMLQSSKVTASQYLEIIQTLYWQGLLWKIERTYRIRPGYEEVYEKMVEVKLFLDDRARELKDAFAAATTPEEVAIYAEEACDYQFLQQVDGLYVNVPGAKGWGWNAWEQYLKAMGRVGSSKQEDNEK